MSGFGQNGYAPLVVEASAHLAVLPGPIGTRTAILLDVSSIHAAYIDVGFTCTQAVSAVDLVIYGASKAVAARVNLFTGVQAANTPLVLRYGGSLAQILGPPDRGQAIGVCYDVEFTNNAAVAAGVISAWTIARS